MVLPAKSSSASVLFTGAPALFVVLWSTGFIGAKMGLPYAEPATFLAIRFLLVAIILGALCWWSDALWPRDWCNVGHILVVGLLVHGIYLGGIYAGISRGITAGDSALIVGMQPILTAILIGPMLAESVRMRQWAGFVLGTLGLGLVSSRYFGGSSSSVSGVAFCIVGVVGMSIGTLYQKRFCSEMDLLSGAFLQFLSATVMMILVALTFETRQVHWTGEFVFALGWLVLVLSLGAMTVLWLLVRAKAATQVASLFFLVPPVTALIAWPLFGETLTLKSVSGMALVVLGILLVKQKQDDGESEQTK